jgi:hypothetical protein
MGDRNLLSKLSQIESNLKKHIDENLELFKDYVDEKTKAKLAREENEFSVNYFTEAESSDIDFILKDEEDANTLINGIFDLKLKYEAHDSSINQKLKPFKTFQLCRYV